MPQFQNLIFKLSFFMVVMTASKYSQAASCSLYTFHGLIKNEDQQTIMVLNPDSRSEIKIKFPDSMQEVLKQHLGSRIEVHSPAEKKNNFEYQVYFKSDSVRYYPFSTEKKDSIKKDSKSFQCNDEK